MATKFSDFMRSVEDQAAAEGPAAVAELETLRAHFRIGRRLAEARVKRRLTQKQVAAKANIDQAEVSNIERGRANPTFETLNRVAMAVNLTVDLVARPRRRAR